jgi:hypothetical protein
VSLLDALDMADGCWLTIAVNDADGIESNALMSGLVIAKPMKGGGSDVLQLYWRYCITWISMTDRSTSFNFTKYQDGIYACNYV